MEYAIPETSAWGETGYSVARATDELAKTKGRGESPEENSRILLIITDLGEATILVISRCYVLIEGAENTNISPSR
ncbi:MAG: hypothetical protein U9N19_06390 [Thermodesulfobacteriota bacterium]|nr:hypothetical protein [Thermodesulfobacteriota bacterium]